MKLLINIVMMKAKRKKSFGKKALRKFPKKISRRRRIEAIVKNRGNREIKRTSHNKIRK